MYNISYKTKKVGKDVTKVHSELFKRIIENQNEKSVETEEVVDQGLGLKNEETFITIISGHKIREKDAFMVIKRGKVVGWGKL